jgi:hypothetical protein
MSATKLICQGSGHGLSFETRGGVFEIIALRGGGVRRTLNFEVVESFPPKSKTGQRLESLFYKYALVLAKMNPASLEMDRTKYNELYWSVRQGLKGD